VPRSYGQYCGLARALDVVGERWSLLIIRELLIRPARYGELLDSLPGVPTNLLADRLRRLEAAGVVERRYDAEVEGVVYGLTAWGLELREAVEALVRWSSPLMLQGRGKDTFRRQWLVIALRALLRGRSSPKPVTVGLEVEGASIAVSLDRSGVDVTEAADRLPAATLRGEPSELLRLAAGLVPVDSVIDSGNLYGSRDIFASVFAPQATDKHGAST